MRVLARLTIAEIPAEIRTGSGTAFQRCFLRSKIEGEILTPLAAPTVTRSKRTLTIGQGLFFAQKVSKKMDILFTIKTLARNQSLGLPKLDLI